MSLLLVYLLPAVVLFAAVAWLIRHRHNAQAKRGQRCWECGAELRGAAVCPACGEIVDTGQDSIDDDEDED